MGGTCSVVSFLSRSLMVMARLCLGAFADCCLLLWPGVTASPQNPVN